MPITLQSIYDRVKTHLLTQNAKSQTSTPLPYEQTRVTCSYRGTEGRTCAVGCLITDECYSRTLEDRAVCERVVYDALACSDVVAGGVDTLGWICLVDRPRDLRLLDALQRVHDGDAVADWPVKLAKVATDFGLIP